MTPPFGTPLRIIAALMFCLLPAPARAADRTVIDQFVTTNWDISDGLPGTRISAVARTADGYLWIATPYGLSRFDGMRFLNLTPENTPTLKVAAIRTLMTGKDGSLWIGTDNGGLYRRTGNQISEVDCGPGIDGKALLSLAEDAEGALWIGTDGAGLFRLRDGKTEAVGLERRDRVARRVSQMTSDVGGGLWLLIDGQVYQAIGGKVVTLPRSAFLSTPALAITASRDGGMWVATEGDHYGGTRIYHVRENVKEELAKPYPWAENSVRSRVYALREDRFGQLWCATGGSGIYYRSPDGKWNKLATQMPLSHAEGLCLLSDETDAMWLGTRTSGLHCIRPQPPITLLHLPAEFDQNIIQSLCLRTDGTIWAGTDSAGLFKWTDEEPSRFFDNAAEGDQRFSVISEDRQGTLWAGTMEGLFRFENNSFTALRSHAGLRHGGICDVLDDGKSGIWVGNLQGVVHLATDYQKSFGKNEGLPGGLIRALSIDPSGKLVVIISGVGVFREEGEQFVRLTVSNTAGNTRHPWNGGPSAHARSMLYESDGTMWITTHGFGLWRIRSGLAEQWTLEDDELPSNYLFGLVDDGKGNLWMGSESGILGVSKRSLAQRRGNRDSPLKTWQLTTADGLVSNVCSGGGRTGAARSPSGMLWFANGPALAGFDPSRIALTPLPHPPILEEVVIDGQLFQQSAKEPVRVKSDARTFELHYASPNLRNPDQLRFRYQLVGLDKGWVNAGNRRVAYYNRLSPGDYQFRVGVAADGDIWQDVAEPLAVVVIPHLYERPEVKLAAAIAVLAAVGGGVWRLERSRSRRRLERLKLQRAMDQERQRIARDIHDDLGSGLTEIILLSDTLRDVVGAIPEAEKSARAISNSARNLTRSMDEVVWAVNPGNDTLESFLNYINDFAQDFLSAAGVRYRWSAPDEVPIITLSSETRHSLYLASKEALNNATRHAGATEVQIRVDLDQPGFRIAIEDNGRGFDTDAIRKRGSGLGNMHHRLLELGGKCNIQSNPCGGSRVTFTIVTSSPRSCPLTPPSLK